MDLETLSREDALWLVSRVQVGRVVYTVGGLPAITPVNFALDGESIVIRTSVDSGIARAVPGSVVAFQVDDIDTAAHTGWTVTIIGRAEDVRDAAEARRLSDLVHPWADDQRDYVIRIDTGLVSGRRLQTHPDGDALIRFSG